MRSTVDLVNGHAPGDLSAWIVAQRPPRRPLDPRVPHGFFLEPERSASGRIVNSGTILLTNKECPWRCLMCDLWKDALPYRVPAGAIPAQIDYACARLNPPPAQLKLYNSGSFFDPGAVPPSDYPAVARSVSAAEHLVVESHPRLVGKRALRLRDLLTGTLEIAIGLETVHPEVLPRLNKRFELAHFEAAAAFLQRHGIGLRVFVLLKPPFLEESEAIEWALKSAEFAFNCGADVVSLIPTRGGNGAMEQLRAAGQFTPPRLATLELTLERALQRCRGRVFADTWDLEQFSTCSQCLDGRRKRLEAMNLAQQVQPPIHCANCGGTTSFERRAAVTN